jgi:hypothetical protein
MNITLHAEAGQSARNLAPWKLELTSLSRDFRFDAAFERPNEPAAQSVL